MSFNKLTNEEIQRIRDVSIHEILGIQNNGRRISLRCPFPSHSDRTASFTLYADNGFHCFGCGKNGQGAIDFVMEMDYPFTEACEELIKYI